MTQISAKGHNGTVVFDGDFVTISRTGGLARLTIGKGDKRIPLQSISAVQWKPPGAMMNGFIAFTIGGGNEKRSRFGSQTVDATKDENAVVVTKRQGPDFVSIRDAIEKAIADRARPASAPAAASSESPVEQLRKLADLHAAGVLTDAEFAAKKAQMLDRM